MEKITSFGKASRNSRHQQLMKDRGGTDDSDESSTRIRVDHEDACGEFQGFLAASSTELNACTAPAADKQPGVHRPALKHKSRFQIEGHSPKAASPRVSFVAVDEAEVAGKTKRQSSKILGVTIAEGEAADWASTPPPPDTTFRSLPETWTSESQPPAVNVPEAVGVRIAETPKSSSSPTPRPVSSRSSQEGVVKSPFQFHTVARLATRPKSRLADPPRVLASGTTDVNAKAGKSGRLKSEQLKPGQPSVVKWSGLLGADEEEGEDPFKDADLYENKCKMRGTFGFWAVFQWSAFVVIIGAFICSLAIPTLHNTKLRGLDLWDWTLVVLVIFCGRLMSGWIITLLVFMVERNFLLRKKVLYFVFGLRNRVKDCLWLGWVLLAWSLIPHKDTEVSKYVAKVLVCLLISVLVLLVKTLFVKILASSFHVAHYFERIQESIFIQAVCVGGPFWASHF